MDESELTRKAIEELMRGVYEHKERDSFPPERKINPLGKPSKRFLGRTLTSALTHNKREDDRNHKRCQHKLQELDTQQRKRVYPEKYKNHRKETRRHSNTPEVISGTSKESKKLKKKKKKFSSSSSTSSIDSDNVSTSSSRSKQKYYGKEEYKDYYAEEANDNDFSYYIDPNMAYAAMAYNQMNNLLQQQQLAQLQLKKEETEVSVEIPSDLDSSCTESESSLNISIHTSSAEEDENGILTFNLSSDDEKSTGNAQKTSLVTERPLQTFSLSNSDQDDNESVYSHISLDSEKTQTETPIVKSDISLLDTSSSDSDLEIVEIYDNFSNTTGNNEVRQKASDKEVESRKELLNENKKIIEPVKEVNEITEDINISEIIEIYDNLSKVSQNASDKEVESRDELLNEDKKIIEPVIKVNEIAENINNSEIIEIYDNLSNTPGNKVSQNASDKEVESREELLNENKKIIEPVGEVNEIAEDINNSEINLSNTPGNKVGQNASDKEVESREQLLNEDKKIIEQVRKVNEIPEDINNTEIIEIYDNLSNTPGNKVGQNASDKEVESREELLKEDKKIIEPVGKVNEITEDNSEMVEIYDNFNNIPGTNKVSQNASDKVEPREESLNKNKNINETVRGVNEMTEVNNSKMVEICDNLSKIPGNNEVSQNATDKEVESREDKKLMEPVREITEDINSEIVEIYDNLSNTPGNEVTQNASDKVEPREESLNEDHKIIEPFREVNEITEDNNSEMLEICDNLSNTPGNEVSQNASDKEVEPREELLNENRNIIETVKVNEITEDNNSEILEICDNLSNTETETLMN